MVELLARPLILLGQSLYTPFGWVRQTTIQFHSYTRREQVTHIASVVIGIALVAPSVLNLLHERTKVLGLGFAILVLLHLVHMIVSQFFFWYDGLPGKTRKPWRDGVGRMVLTAFSVFAAVLVLAVVFTASASWGGLFIGVLATFAYPFTVAPFMRLTLKIASRLRARFERERRMSL